MSEHPAARAHADRHFVRRQHTRLGEPLLAPLNRLAKQMEDDPAGDGLPVPRFDPSSGGVHARALLLFQDPGPMTGEAGSGLISPYNDDPSAARVLGSLREAGLHVSDLVFWNVYPWLRPGEANQPIRAADMDAGLRWLRELVVLLPQLRVIAVFGRVAQLAMGRPAAASLDGFHLVLAPHPSARSWNQPGHPEAIRSAYREVARLMSPDTSGSPEVVDCWPRR